MQFSAPKLPPKSGTIRSDAVFILTVGHRPWPSKWNILWEVILFFEIIKNHFFMEKSSIQWISSCFEKTVFLLSIIVCTLAWAYSLFTLKFGMNSQSKLFARNFASRPNHLPPDRISGGITKPRECISWYAELGPCAFALSNHLVPFSRA